VSSIRAGYGASYTGAINKEIHSRVVPPGETPWARVVQSDRIVTRLYDCELIGLDLLKSQPGLVGRTDCRGKVEWIVVDM
jgi:hypothetical protein